MNMYIKTGNFLNANDVTLVELPLDISICIVFISFCLGYLLSELLNWSYIKSLKKYVILCRKELGWKPYNLFRNNNDVENY